MGKKIFISIVLISLFFSKKILSLDMEFFQIYSKKIAWANYTGISYNKNCILIYSRDGTILISTNNLNEWERAKVDYDNIVSIDSLGNKFLALSQDGTILESINNGFKWNNKLKLDGGLFIKLKSFGTNFCVLSQKKIYVFDNNYNLVNDFPYNADTVVYDLTFYKDIIYYSAGKCKLGLFNIITKQNQIIDLNKLNLCTTCGAPLNIDIYDDSTVYFKSGKNLYLLNIKTNMVDSICQLIAPSGVVINFKQSLLNFWNILFPQETSDTLYTYQINPSSREMKSLTSRVNRYFKNSIFASCRWLSGDTIVAVGKNNLLFISFDGAKSWVVFSFLSPFPDNYFVFDRNNIRSIYNSVNFGFTDDGGKTWLNMQNWFSDFDIGPYYKSNTGFFKDKKNGFYYNPNGFVVSYDGGNSCQIVKRDKIYGNLFNWGTPFLNYKNLFFVLTTVGLKFTTYSILHFLDDTLGMVKSSYFANKHFFLFPPDDPWSDTLFAITSSIYQKSYYISYSIDTGLTWTDYFQFPLDGIYLFQRFNLKKYGDDFLIIALRVVSDTVYFHECYSFNWKTKQFTKLFEYKADEKLKNFGNMVKVNDTTLLLVYTYFAPKPSTGLLVNYNFYKDPTNWQKYDFTGKRYRITSIYSSVADSVLFVFANDTLFNELTAFILWKEQPTTVVETPKAEQNPIFLLTEPVPQPSKESVSVKIYFDYRYDIGDCKIDCYNLLGTKVTTRLAFETKLLNHYTAEIYINTQNLPSGFYLIAVTLGNQTKTIPLIVE